MKCVSQFLGDRTDFGTNELIKCEERSQCSSNEDTSGSDVTAKRFLAAAGPGYLRMHQLLNMTFSVKLKYYYIDERSSIQYMDGDVR